MAKKKAKKDDREINPTDKVDEVGLDPTTVPGYFDNNPTSNPALDAAPEGDFEGTIRLTKDLRAASKLLSRREARYLLDDYYQTQKRRQAENNRIRSGQEFGEPVGVLSWFAKNNAAFENDLKKALGQFARQYRVGNWLQSICGIQDILSAGLIAQLDVPPPETVGKWYRFAGLDPTIRWWGTKAGGEMVRGITGDSKKVGNNHLMKIAETLNMRFTHLVARLAQEKLDATSIKDLSAFCAKRPWNARLKWMTTFICGESFIKVQNNPNDFYGKLYVTRKQYETAKNANKDYADQAAKCLLKLKDKSTPAYKANAAGFLAPGHIHNRARRWTAKIFLSHVHEMFYWDFYGKAPPAPFIFTKDPGNHTHYIPPPGKLDDFEGKRLHEMTGLELTHKLIVPESPENADEDAGDADSGEE